MSSYDGGGFEEWLRDSIFQEISEETLKKLSEVLEPHREMIDRMCCDYDKETQSWREYRNSLWSLIPPDVDQRVREILDDAEAVRRLATDPRTLHWVFGSLPDVETVPFDRRILIWSKEFVGLVLPWGDNLNPLRWCDDSGFPRWGTGRPSGFWTVIREGTKKRPQEIKTWAELYGEDASDGRP
jgi:hypothetical protein